jgi:hypothetical protein
MLTMLIPAGGKKKLSKLVDTFFIKVNDANLKY